MKKIISAFVILLLSIPINGQIRETKNHSLQGLTCKTCHTCEVPTKQSPCLVACPRSEMITIDQTAEESPAVVTLDKIGKNYLPVIFSHKIHAQMSQMAGGCASCHHYNTVGPIQKCENCHDVNRKREDISKPDLKGAYHRQCMECHREWSHSTDCTSCHLLKTGSDKNITQQLNINIKDHPDVPEPTKIVYETEYNKGKLVTFFHDDHTGKFKIDCKSCHQKESCNRCHDQQKLSVVEQTALGETIKIHKPKNEQHKPCFSCHQNDECSSCHKNEPMQPFDHKIAAGWELNKYHVNLSCVKCHGETTTFKKLDKSCISCHNNFVEGKFDHKITGLVFDDIHKGLTCTDCHAENNFSSAPTCINCHDDKSYPKEKPGKLINRNGK